MLYVQRSIARAANITPEQLTAASGTTTIILEHAKEWKLALRVLKFTEVILRCVSDLFLHTLCDYLYDLASTFTEFYDACYVIEKNRTTG